MSARRLPTNGHLARIATGAQITDAAQASQGAHTAPKRQKYGVRTDAAGIAARTVDGVVFDSRAEAGRYRTLAVAMRVGEIAGLVLHPKYEFIVNGVRVGSYRPDFRYERVATGETVVEDVKSAPTKTEAYGLRKRLMAACHGIKVTEVAG